MAYVTHLLFMGGKIVGETPVMKNPTLAEVRAALIAATPKGVKPPKAPKIKTAQK